MDCTGTVQIRSRLLWTPRKTPASRHRAAESPNARRGVRLGSVGGRRYLTGTDVPIRAVELKYLSGKWHVSGAETMGPNSPRLGFTETIDSEFEASTEDFDGAVELLKSL